MPKYNYNEITRHIANVCDMSIITNMLTKEQTDEIHKIWADGYVISWLEALGIWLLSINPDYQKQKQSDDSSKTY